MWKYFFSHEKNPTELLNELTSYKFLQIFKQYEERIDKTNKWIQ